MRIEIIKVFVDETAPPLRTKTRYINYKNSFIQSLFGYKSIKQISHNDKKSNNSILKSISHTSSSSTLFWFTPIDQAIYNLSIRYGGFINYADGWYNE